MKKILLIVAIVGLIIGIALLVRSHLLGKQKTGGLQVTSEPKATIFLEGKHLGQTPFSNKELKAGEFTLRLIPESEMLTPWEQKIKLSPGILTVVNREFAESEEFSSGEILTLESLANKNLVSLAVISNPDGALVKVDGVTRGLTPISLEDVTEGDHLISLSLPGFLQKEVRAKTALGRKLIVNVKLAKEKAEAQEATSSAKEEFKKPYVKIKVTPTGWLRVRFEPNTAATEAAKVKPGEKYKFLEATETGWYKIEYEEGKEGWISGQYAEKFE